MALRGTRQQVEILAAGDGEARVTRQYVEILAAITVVYDVSATDSLAVVDEAISTVVYEVIASDTLSLDEVARRIYEVSAFDLIALGSQAIGVLVRVSYDTLILVDEAIVSVISSITDTLSLGEEASFIAERFRSIEDILALQDEGIVTGVFYRKAYESLLLTDAVSRVIAAFDTLGLSEQANADRILGVSDTLVLSDEVISFTIYPRAAGDSLTFVETAIPGYVTLREVSDTLNLSETAIGDYCQVVDDTLVLTDEADYEFVRLIHDELTLNDEASFIGVFGRRAWETTLTLTDEAHLAREIDVEASDTVSLIELVSLIFGVTDTLSLSDSATAVSSRVAYDTLTLSDEAVATRNRYSGLDELVLADTATFNIIRSVATRDTIVFSEQVGSGFHRKIASDAIQTSYIEYDPYTYEETIVYVGLQDLAQASVVYATPKTVEDHLSFAEHALGIKINWDAIAASASDSFSLIEDVRTNLLGSADDSFAFIDAAEVIASKLLADELDLSDAASYNINRNNLLIEDTLELGETVLWYNQLEDFLYVYHPFVGEGSGDLPDPPDEELEGPIPGITDPFKLVYPVTGPFSDTLVLRAPNLGNRDRLQMNRISRETRGGTLIVYADSMWPKIQTLVLDFSGLTWTEASGLHAFMDAHLGLEIGVLDWEHRFWRGVITEQNEPIVQDGPGCKYTIGFEFEGQLATYDPGP